MKYLSFVQVQSGACLRSMLLMASLWLCYGFNPAPAAAIASIARSEARLNAEHAGTPDR